MNKAAILFFIAIVWLCLPSVALAEKYIINVKGEPKTADGKIDLMYSAGLVTDQGMIESDSKIDNDNGYFEIKNAVLDTDASFNYVAVAVQGSCFYHNYSIFRVGDYFEVSDGYDPTRKVVIKTADSDIDLGALKEDKSNQLTVDSNIPVKLLVEDLSGNWVAENTNFNKLTTMSNSFKSNTRYKLTLTTANGDQIEKEISTGGYCESVRLIKRGGYFLIESFPNNSLPSVGFFRNIWLNILGLFLMLFF